jgi:type II secretory pathway component GspD/PulD (secretin)
VPEPLRLNPLRIAMLALSATSVRFSSLLIMTALCLLSLSPTLAAADAAEFQVAEQDAYSEVRSVSFTMKNIELGQAAQFVASLTKTRITIDDSFIRTKVNCQYDNASFSDVMLDLAKQARGEVWYKEGKTKTFLLKPVKK